MSAFHHFHRARQWTVGGDQRLVMVVATLANGQSYDLGEGERFHRTPEIKRRWLAEFPFHEISTSYLVAKPLADTAADEPIALVHWHVNPDQLAALVTLTGFEHGAVETATAPWGAACQAIAYAYPETTAQRFVRAAIGALRKRPQATKAARAPSASVKGVCLASPPIR